MKSYLKRLLSSRLHVRTVSGSLRLNDLNTKFSSLLLPQFVSFLHYLCCSNIYLKVAGIRLNGEEAPPEMASALGKMDISIYSDGRIQKSVVSMMMMNTTSIMDSKQDSIHIYMDMMGKKYKISENRKANLEAANESMKAIDESMVITEFKEDVKEILGYKCHRVELKMKMPKEKTKAEDDQDVTIKMYVTNELKFDPSYITQTSKKIQLNGTPLEYNMAMGSGSFKMELTMKAKEYKPEIRPEDLLPPTGNFKSYTMEDFQNEMSRTGQKR
jgi:hypothetical protein